MSSPLEDGLLYNTGRGSTTIFLSLNFSLRQVEKEWKLMDYGIIR